MLNPGCKSYFVALECNIYFDIHNHIHILLSMWPAMPLYRKTNRICPFMALPIPILWSNHLCSSISSFLFLLLFLLTLSFCFIQLNIPSFHFSCRFPLFPVCAPHFVKFGFFLRLLSSRLDSSRLIPFRSPLPPSLSQSLFCPFPICSKQNVIFCNISRFNSITFLQAMHYSVFVRSLARAFTY